ncbi:hypothetical protein ACQUW2_02255, partial [Enterobacter hormaechei]
PPPGGLLSPLLRRPPPPPPRPRADNRALSVTGFRDRLEALAQQ